MCDPKQTPAFAADGLGHLGARWKTLSKEKQKNTHGLVQALLKKEICLFLRICYLSDFKGKPTMLGSYFFETSPCVDVFFVFNQITIRLYQLFQRVLHGDF